MGNLLNEANTQYGTTLQDPPSDKKVFVGCLRWNSRLLRSKLLARERETRPSFKWPDDSSVFSHLRGSVMVQHNGQQSSNGCYGNGNSIRQTAFRRRKRQTASTPGIRRFHRKSTGKRKDSDCFRACTSHNTEAERSKQLGDESK